MDKQVVQLPAKAMFSQAVAGVLIASILLVTSILTSFALSNDSEWNGSLKRDIQGFKPGMIESRLDMRWRVVRLADTRFSARCPRKKSVLSYLLPNTRGRVW